MNRVGENVRLFGFAHVVTVASLASAFVIGGTKSLVVVALLGVLEIAVSFDNAIEPFRSTLPRVMSVA
jgi:hypothetical protein